MFIPMRDVSDQSHRRNSSRDISEHTLSVVANWMIAVIAALLIVGVIGTYLHH